MIKIFFVTLCLIITSTAYADEFPNNECALIVASRENISEVTSYIDENISDKRYLKIYKSQNGWLSISIGMLEPDEVGPVIKKWKASGKIPQDSYCTTGTKIVREISLDGNPIAKNKLVNIDEKDFNYINKNNLTKSDLSKYTKEQLRLLRNYYFAKKGFPFKAGSDLETFFKQFSWYSPKEIESAYIFDNLLSKKEKNNVTLILATERGKSTEQIKSDLAKKHNSQKKHKINKLSSSSSQKDLSWATTHNLKTIGSYLPDLTSPKTRTFRQLKNAPSIISKIKQDSKGLYLTIDANSGSSIYFYKDRCVKGFIRCKQYVDPRLRVKINNNDTIYILKRILNISNSNLDIQHIRRTMTPSTPEERKRNFVIYDPSDEYIAKSRKFLKQIRNDYFDVDLHPLQYVKFKHDEKIILFFPYKGKAIKTFDFIEGDQYFSNRWFYENITIFGLSDEEKLHQKKILQAISQSMPMLNKLTANEKTILLQQASLDGKYKKVYDQLSNNLSTDLSKKGNELELAKTINNFTTGSSAQQNAILSLIKLLRAKKDINLYWDALNILDSSIDGVTEIANDLAKETWEQLIEPSDDLEATIKFINEFNGASGDIVSSAYEKAVQLGEKQLNDTYQKMIEKNPQTSKLQIAERLARRYYKQAIRAKDSDNEITFAVKYEIVTTAPILEETEAGFNLYRDSEMKKFLQKNFDKLIKQNRQASADLIEQFSALGEKLDDLSSSMESSGEVNLEEERKANYRFLVQGYYFDKAMNGDK